MATGKVCGTKDDEAVPEKYGGVPKYGSVKVDTAIA
jgi:hypothetical protein